MKVALLQEDLSDGQAAAIEAQSLCSTARFPFDQIRKNRRTRL